MTGRQDKAGAVRKGDVKSEADVATQDSPESNAPAALRAVADFMRRRQRTRQGQNRAQEHGP